MPSEYRPRIYEHYGTGFQDAPGLFDAAAARRWGRAYDHYLRGWLPRDKGAAVAELACGRGNMLHFLQERGYINLEAVDLSPEQANLARQVLPSVKEGDAIAFLEAHKSQFDLIIALDLIEHLKKDEVLRFLDAAYNAMVPGASLILQTPNAGSPWFGTMRYNDFTHEVCFNANSLMRLLRLAGFQEVQFRETAPVPWGYSWLSTLRSAAWQVLRAGLTCWDIIETGAAREGLYTRNFLARARKSE
jgi:cyclopropane fatty-acyl-phospholipid synthase-like methyltransferase